VDKSTSASSHVSVPRVFISSTSEDLEPFRAAAKEAVIEAQMLPVMSEHFPASSSNPPLEECLQKVSQTDVLIVLVAHRYGWMPVNQPMGKPRKSITWLECQQAVDDKHDVLGFFIGHDGPWPEEHREEHRLAKAARERKLTPELSDEVQEALDGLQAFQQWLNGLGIRREAQSPEELGKKIILALAQWRKNHPEFGTAPVSPALSMTPEKYLAGLLKASSFIDIRGLAVGSGKAHRFPIEDLYIALRSRQGVRRSDDIAKTTTKESGEPGGVSPRMLERELGEMGEVPLQAALAERRLVVIGDPGAGKTTFLRRIAAALCETELGIDPNAAKDRLGIADKTFPIFLRCATLANHIAAHCGKAGAPTDVASPAWLAHCLAAQSRESGTGLDQAFVQRQLEAGKCTVLLDGLDESPDRMQRDGLSQLAENLSRTFAECRFVVTSRPPAYTGTTVLPQFAHVEIAPLSDEAVDTFLGHWCRQLYGGDTAESKAHIRELLDSLHARPEIRRVARNPVMLTALAVVHWNERRLPEQRAELYESVITWLSRSRENRPGREKPERTVTLLQEVALAMHNHPDGRQTQVPKRWAAEHVLASHFGPKKPTAKSIAAAEEFLTDEELDSGIVVALGSNVRFWHLQFQEYLAARAIAAQPEAAQRALLGGADSKWYRAEWREVILLLAGALHKQGEAKVTAFVQQVLDSVPSHTKSPSLADEARCAGLLGAVFHDLKPAGYQPNEPRYDQLLHRVMAIFDRERSQSVDVRVRIAAAEALGQVGDPRLEHNAPHRWITIPAGSFRMGSQTTDNAGLNFDEEAGGDEGPVHEVTLAAFSIARFPVTVGEFQRFVDDDGYSTEKFWKVGGGFEAFEEPAEWSNQIEFRNRPAVGVSWYEAMAYCVWSGTRLPTEAEWERAARGTTGRKYPWGNEPADPTRLNFEGNVGTPTPVGIYPLGATPEGIDDLAGNVWEWCHDAYDGRAYQQRVAGVTNQVLQPGDVGKANAVRVIRGGSWSAGAADCRAALRIGDWADYRFRGDFRYRGIGFRVCLESGPIDA
jgi:formylglycine-generating enzyme required for sulfatase activity